LELQRDLTQGSVAKQLARFSLPFLLSNLLQALYGIVDTLVVSWFASPESVTGVSLSSQITTLVTYLAVGLGSGASVMVAQYFGAKMHEDVKKTVATTFTSFFLMALGLTLVVELLGGAVLRLIDTPQEAFAEARSYLNICTAGMVFTFIYNAINAILRGMGDSKRPLVFVAIACVVNVGLDFLFTGVMDMGAAGVAWATVIAQAVSVVLSVTYLMRKDFVFDFRLKSFRVYKEKLWMMCRIGLPTALQNAVVMISFLFVARLVNAYGLLAATMSGIVTKINSLVTLPFGAVNGSISAMVGQSMGAGRIERIPKILFCGLGYTIAIGGLIFAIVQIFPQTVLGLFTPEPEVIAIGVDFLRAYSVEYLIMAFTFCLNGVIIGTGHSLYCLIAIMSIAVGLRMPLAVLFSQTLGMGLPGIALGSGIAPIGVVVTGVIFMLLGKWKTSKIPLRVSEEA